MKIIKVSSTSLFHSQIFHEATSPTPCVLIQSFSVYYTAVFMCYMLSCVRLFGTPRTVTHQVPPPMGLYRQEYWSGLLFPPPWDLPDPEMETVSPASSAIEGGFFTTKSSGKCLLC